VIAATAIAAPSAVFLTRHSRVRRWTLGLVNIIQTIPSLALFGFILPLPFIGGVGKQTAILALILYALLPILRNTVVGIKGVDATVRESAVAMGMTDGQILRSVELPLALPTILVGIRIATVTTIGTATIAAAIGGGGLGTFVFRGIAMADTKIILAGAVPAALMAITADEVLEWVERRFSY
jgi:osmoprotectant transport system permease protein